MGGTRDVLNGLGDTCGANDGGNDVAAWDGGDIVACGSVGTTGESAVNDGDRGEVDIMPGCTGDCSIDSGVVGTGGSGAVIGDVECIGNAGHGGCCKELLGW